MAFRHARKSHPSCLPADCDITVLTASLSVMLVSEHPTQVHGFLNSKMCDDSDIVFSSVLVSSPSQEVDDRGSEVLPALRQSHTFSMTHSEPLHIARPRPLLPFHVSCQTHLSLQQRSLVSFRCQYKDNIFKLAMFDIIQ